MHPNEQLITRFYQAFQKGDGKGMGACYGKDAEFSDPVFPDLKGDEARRMWSMLTSRAKDLEITFDGVVADDEVGEADWVATYTFQSTGRRVRNVIHASFAFENGKIAQHIDSFSFWRWSRQALGPVGWLLGWTPLLRSKVRKDAATRLADWR